MSEKPTRDVYDFACRMNNEYKKGSYHWQINYWKRLYDAMHPSKSQSGTDTRKKCMEVLKKALPWHLEHTPNINERAEIQAAIKEIAQYAG